MKSILFVLITVLMVDYSVAQQPGRQRQRGQGKGDYPGRPGVTQPVTTLPVNRPQPGSNLDIGILRQELSELLRGFPEASLSSSTAKFDKLAKAYQAVKKIEGADDYIRAVARALIHERPGSSVLTETNIINTLTKFQDTSFYKSDKSVEILIKIIDRYAKFLDKDKADSGESTLRLAAKETLAQGSDEKKLAAAIEELEQKHALFSLRSKTDGRSDSSGRARQ